MTNFQHFLNVILLFYVLSIFHIDGGNVQDKFLSKLPEKLWASSSALPPTTIEYDLEAQNSPGGFVYQSAEETSNEISESPSNKSSHSSPVSFESNEIFSSQSSNQIDELPSEQPSQHVSSSEQLSVIQSAEMSSKQSTDYLLYAPECESRIYCFGHLLAEISFAQIYSSKWSSNQFVDLRMLFDEATISKRFENLLKKEPNPSKNTLKSFVRENFARDLAKKCDLADYTDRLPIVDGISDARYKDFAISVHYLWKDLAKKVDDDARENPDRHSFIYVPNCFIGNVVNQKPFMSYLNNYWITQGLIRSNMLQTYKGILENIFHIIDKHGQMLTGNNVYFMGRSHPPLLIKMAKNYQDIAPDGEKFIERNISILTAEFEWWYKYRMVEFEKDGKKYKMARYHHQRRAIPRPETFSNDFFFANTPYKTIKLNKQQRADYYRAVRAATESGYGSSSRFLRDGKHISGPNSFLNMDTHNIIPTDLNSILEFNSRQLGQWYRSFNKIAIAERYEKISEDLRNAIHDVLRNDNRGIWFDYNLESRKNNHEFVASNFTPLFTNSSDSALRKHYGKRAVEYLIEEKIIRPDGTPRYYCVPVTKIYTLQKWDFPNCFPQAMSFIIEGLRNTGYELASKVAKNLAAMWIRTNYEAFSKYNRMFQKYNALKLSNEPIIGEERKIVDVPIGYGPTNGFLLTLFDYYGNEVTADDYRYNFESPSIFKLEETPGEDFHFNGE